MNQAGISDPSRRLTWIAGGLSAAWIIAGVWYAACFKGWSTFQALAPNELGDFLTGFFSPLAFGWFVVAVWLQRQELQLQRAELSQTRKALEGQHQELGNQSGQLRISSQAASRDSFVRMAQIVEAEVNVYAINIVCALTGQNSGEYRRQALASGDSSYILNGLADALANIDQKTVIDKLNSKDKTKISCNKFCEYFEILLIQLHKLDDDFIDFYEKSLFSNVYSLICSVSGRESRLHRHDAPEFNLVPDPK